MMARAIAVGLLLGLGGCHLDAESTPPSSPALQDPDHAAVAPEREAPPVRPSLDATPHEPRQPYDRAAWRHWIDADGDCQDTRTEILIAQSQAPVTFRSDRRCDVARGQWVCPYTGKRITDPAVIDIDHLVPLARAHAAGAERWDATRRSAYANDLDDPMALIAVDRSANRSRGARGVHEWLPPDPSHRCDFLEAYANLARKWDLQLDPEEEDALFQFLETCDAGRVPELAQLDAPKAEIRALTDPDPQAPPRSCCKHCRKGKPCGDTCIPEGRTCHAGAGCAC